jgi:hypothetical protein
MAAPPRDTGLLMNTLSEEIIVIRSVPTAMNLARPAWAARRTLMLD